MLVVGVLLLQLGFILSYVDAFHDPVPHRIRLAVVAPSTAEQTASQLDALPGSPLRTRVAASRQAAVDDIRHRDIEGALVRVARRLGRAARRERRWQCGLIALARIVGTVEQRQPRGLTVTDVVPAEAQDSRGLSSFYLAVGWVVGGYLVAAILAISGAARPVNPGRSQEQVANPHRLQDDHHPPARARSWRA